MTVKKLLMAMVFSIATLIIFIIIAIIYSCDDNSTSHDSIIFDKEFPTTKSLNISKTLPIEVLHTRGLIISNSYIITYNRKDDKIIKVYCRGDYHLKGEFLTKGRSRDEVMSMMKIMQKDETGDHLKLLIQSHPKYMNWIDIDSSLVAKKAIFCKRNEFRTSKQREIINNSGASYDLGSDIVLMRYNRLKRDSVNPIMLFYDLKNSCEVDRMTWSDLKKTEFVTELIHGGNSSISPDKKKVAQAYFSLDLVTFYDLEAKTKKKVFFSKGAMNYLQAQKDMELFYRSCAGGDDYFFALKEPTKEQKDKNINRAVQLFTWDGTPKFEFLVKEEILLIDVDTKNKQMYAVINCPNNSGEIKIVIYELPI